MRKKHILWGGYGLCLTLLSQGANADLQDPTKPSDYREAGGKEIGRSGPVTLSAILISGSRKNAIINNKVVEEGDTVEGLQVKKIEKEGVKLIGEKGEIEVHLLGKSIKEPSK